MNRMKRRPDDIYYSKSCRLVRFLESHVGNIPDFLQYDYFFRFIVE